MKFFDIVYPTRPSDAVTKYTIYRRKFYFIGWNIIHIVLGLILVLYLMASKTWLKNAFRFTFWDRSFALVLSNKSSFFIPFFWYQDSNSYYFVVGTAKIPKLWKRTSLGVFFLYADLKIMALTASELFNRNLSIVHPTFF